MGLALPKKSTAVRFSIDWIFATKPIEISISFHARNKAGQSFAYVIKLTGIKKMVWAAYQTPVEQEWYLYIIISYHQWITQIQYWNADSGVWLNVGFQYSVGRERQRPEAIKYMHSVYNIDTWQVLLCPYTVHRGYLWMVDNSTDNVLPLQEETIGELEPASLQKR